MSGWLILTGSLLGSLHCAAMCGGFSACVKREGQPAYHLGRLGAYVLLGALAGALGASLDFAGERWLGVQRAAGIVLGALLVFQGLKAFGLWQRPVKLGAKPSRLLRLRQLLGRSALGIGLLSVVLPCAWLWSFVTLAGASGSPASGALVMAVFWVGTVPALTALGLFAGQLSARLGRFAPRATAVALVAAGLFAMAGKLGPVLDPTPGEAPPHCHGHAEAR